MVMPQEMSEYRHMRWRWPHWTGLGEKSWPAEPNREVRRSKTLWDWLQLLIVPAILVAVTFAWSAAQTRSDNKREDRRSQDATLQAYFDDMRDLMLDNKLSTEPGKPTRIVARTLTLTALRRLDGERKTEVVTFLYSAGLLNAWSGSFFSRVSLFRADLTGAELADAFLPGATLAFADLESADLTGATLSTTRLMSARFTGANL